MEQTVVDVQPAVLAQKAVHDWEENQNEGVERYASKEEDDIKRQDFAYQERRLE